MLDPETVKWISLGWDVVQGIALGGLWFYTVVTRKSVANQKALERLESAQKTSVEEFDERLTRVEERVASAPTHADLAAIHERINDSITITSEMKGEFRGTSRVVDRIHDFLMTQPRPNNG